MDPQHQRIASAAIGWSGIVYRCTSVQYAASADLLSGKGALRRAGRWNPTGLAAVVYASLEPEHAISESLADHRYHGIPVQEAMPRVIAAIEVSLKKVVDLNVEKICAIWGTSTQQLVKLDWRGSATEPLTHGIARACFQAGVEALLVPSAAVRSGRNLVMFPQNFGQGSHLKGL
ncbi:MAG: RES family NAD+ phosphorylase [Phycisphaerales bacterium]|nr:RES family NAD+ phosphorylase [Phycisphaerales bacterium]